MHYTNILHLLYFVTIDHFQVSYFCTWKQTCSLIFSFFYITPMPWFQKSFYSSIKGNMDAYLMFIKFKTKFQNKIITFQMLFVRYVKLDLFRLNFVDFFPLKVYIKDENASQILLYHINIILFISL